MKIQDIVNSVTDFVIKYFIALCFLSCLLSFSVLAYWDGYRVIKPPTTKPQQVYFSELVTTNWNPNAVSTAFQDDNCKTNAHCYHVIVNYNNPTNKTHTEIILHMPNTLYLLFK